MSYDIDPKNPKETTVSVNDGKRTYFVKVGDKISNTVFRAQAFDRKSRPKADGPGTEDISEPTLINEETKEISVLSLGRGPLNEKPSK